MRELSKRRGGGEEGGVFEGGIKEIERGVFCVDV